MPLTQRAMDRELAMALTTATADDDEKCPDDVMKRLVKLSGKQKDPAALEDLVATLAAIAARSGCDLKTHVALYTVSLSVRDFRHSYR